MLSTQELTKLRRFVSLDDERSAEVFDALSEPNRCKLFRVILKKPDLNVSDAAAILGVSVSLASQHLKILENHNLLVRTKNGREVSYRVNEKDALVAAVAGVVD